MRSNASVRARLCIGIVRNVRNKREDNATKDENAKGKTHEDDLYLKETSEDD